MNGRCKKHALMRTSLPCCAFWARRRGFTLMELLVVVAIIGLLIGLLMPAMSAARQQARRTRAKAEARQLVVAFNHYMNDNPGAALSGEISMDAGNAALIRGKYMEIAPGAFLDPWKQMYQVRFGDSSGGDSLTRTYQTRAFLYNYNRDNLGDEP